MRSLVVLVLALVPLALAAVPTTPYPIGPVPAGGPGCIGSPADVLEVGVGVKVFYLVDTGYLDHGDLFVYEEGNGVYHDPSLGDLQRGGHSRLDGATDDCYNRSPTGPDALLL